MRKLLTVAAMATLALGTVAACTTAPPGGTATSSPAVTTPASDNSKAVCAEATAYAATASAGVLAKYNEGAQALTANDLVKAQAAVTAGKQLLTDWSTKFKDLATQPIKPDVKTALTDIATFADQTASATTADPAAVQAQFTQLNGKLAGACATA